MGFFDVPTVERKPWGILGLILNIVFPGVGNIVAGAKDGHKNSIIRGILQLLLAWLILPWIWSIVDGVRIFKASSGATWNQTPTVAAEPEPAPEPAPAAAAAPKAAAKKAPAKKAAAKPAPKKAAAKGAKKAAK